MFYPLPPVHPGAPFGSLACASLRSPSLHRRQFAVSLNASSTKFVLFLEGGGWHFFPAGWTGVGSGSLAGASPADIGGVMSDDPALNPDFYSWNKVFMHCEISEEKT